MTKSSLILCVLLICANATADSEISVEKLSAGKYQIQITSTDVLDPSVAQELLVPTAQSLCNDSFAQFGHYRFASSVSLTDPAPQGDELVFIQEIECTVENLELEAARNPNVSSQEHRSAIEAEVKALSERYFAEVLAGNYEAAYSRLAESMKSFRKFDEWTAQMEKFRDEVGTVTELNIHTITVYDNPPNAPEPGLYVAADYQNRFARAPYHCGYLVWFRSRDNSFKIIREESGWITNQMLLQVPGEQIPGLLSQFRCVTR